MVTGTIAGLASITPASGFVGPFEALIIGFVAGILCQEGTIFIKKNIPVSGGMGGGSSNAAAALVGINNLYSLNLSPLELMKIGKKLGADVPFFLFGKNAIDHVRFSFAASQDNISQALENIKKMLG